ncbi:hypothetical protein Athai_57450 [Actinocatenispora thailandica]|uniref:histidine kinase n=1 Tax=Actinocatenispora thailandica TaxID=227318 RepID=A0A7R7HZE3_9ACTN|nr:histidine kinase [Actinocatenispora thailandica]BCJ38242.1 hypothetical protein Athai_57450 [Actinocatenispora thailandica]
MPALPRLPAAVDRHLGPVLMWVGATALTAAVTVNTLPRPFGIGGGYAHVGPAAVAGTVAVAAALLRRYPLAGLTVLLAGAVAAAGVIAGRLSMPGSMQADPMRVGFAEMIPAYLALCYVSSTRSRRTALLALGLSLLVPAGYDVPVLVRAADLSLWAYQAPVLYVAVFGWLVGQSIRKSRQLASASRAQTAERAMTAERLRLARELHDMVAHSVGIIAIQAGVGNRVIHTQPDAAQEALRVIETSSREALSGLRRTLVALRRADPTGPEPAGTPGLADLDRLVASAAEAGIEVSVRRTGTVRPVPAEVDLAGYRIVQESLTNVIRHSTARHCRVEVGYRPAELVIEIVDDGRARGAAGRSGSGPGSDAGRGNGSGPGSSSGPGGGSRPVSGSGPSGMGGPSGPSGASGPSGQSGPSGTSGASGTGGGEHELRTGAGHGFGIIGMRERAALLDGRLDAGPRPDRGFRVAATLPLPATTTGPDSITVPAPR